MSEFERLLRRIVLGVSAAPLVLLPGCGRSELVFEPDASVIPSRDAGFMQRDAGTFDAGTFDAGPFDAGLPDAGLSITYECEFIPAMTMSGVVVQFDPGKLLTPAECLALCQNNPFGSPIEQCQPVGTMELVCWNDFCAIGRQAPSVEVTTRGAAGLGRHFAQMAALEATAVVAFEQLAGELGRHGLPRPLRRAAKKAAHEERRHTALVGTLARRLGGRASVERTAPAHTRSVEDLAFDNAVEGCVRETFGAMVGLYQSLHAPDAELRRTFASITNDELGHGRWSWALAEELERRLPLASRKRARELRDRALETMTCDLLEAHSPEARQALGLPDRERLETMATALRAQLFTRRGAVLAG